MGDYGSLRLGGSDGAVCEIFTAVRDGGSYEGE